MSLSNSEPNISIVVPLFNEANSLPELLRRLLEVMKSTSHQFEFIFVNDGSKDNTLSVLRGLVEECPNLRVVDLARNYGQTAALAAGIDAARGKIIVTMDGDLQHDPVEIPRFLAKIEEGFDVVSGWRESRSDSYLLRRLPSQVANYLMRCISRTDIRDFGSTFKAYRADLVKQLELFGELHRFIPALAYQAGAKIVEIPICVQQRSKGQSNYGLMRTFGVFEDLVFLMFYLHYLTKPIRAFGLLFFMCFGVGFAISAGLMFLWFLGIIPSVYGHAALLLFSVFLMTVGVLFLGVGILAEFVARIYHHTSMTKIYRIRQTLGE